MKKERAFDLLSEQKILKDTEQTPLMRVTLREIKDFAVPIYVHIMTARKCSGNGTLHQMQMLKN